MARGFAALSPAQRSLMSQVANYTRWGRTTTKAGRTAGTATARQANRDRWAAEVDPDGTLPAAERDAAIARLQKAHMARMTLKSARARGQQLRPAKEKAT